MGLFDNFRQQSDIEPQAMDLEQKKIQNSFTSWVEKTLKHGKGITSDSIMPTGLEVTGQESPLMNANDALAKKQVLYNFSKNAIVQAVLRTRINQVSVYGTPARLSADNVGFKIVPNKKGTDDRISARKQSYIESMEDFIEHTGSQLNPQTDNFTQFLASYVNNSFTYDQINVEKIWDNSGKLDHFNMLDAGTITLAKTPHHVEELKHMLQFKNFQQVNPIKLKEPDVTFVTSNHSSNLQKGYGFSKVEAAMQEIQNQDNGEQYNSRFFTQGGTTKGILVLDSGDDTQQSYAALQNIQRQWNTAGQGLSGAWRIPLISAHGAQFVNMSQNTQELGLDSYMTMCINTITAIMGIDPQLINFPNKGGGASSKSSSSTLNEGNSRANASNSDRDKGLKPLLKEIENFMNTYIMSELDNKYRFKFVNGNSKDELLEQQIIEEKSKNGMTFNEVRALNGLPSLEGPKNDLGINIYDLPMNPVFIQEFQLVYGQTKEAQEGLQHKNDLTPSKAENGQPDKAGVKLNAEQAKENDILDKDK